MKENYYLVKSGTLKRKEKTVYFETEGMKRALPIENIDGIYVFGELSLNKRLLELLNENKIPIHFFNYFGFYSGSYFPREYLNSGVMVVNQVKHYLNKKKRLHLAKEIIRGAIHNIQANLKYYKRRGKSLEKEIKEIKNYRTTLPELSNVAAVMGLEGNVRKIYNRCFNKILRKEFRIKARIKRPPNNMVNCLISFGNSLLYRTVLSEIYRTYLIPTISYLHEPRKRRFSLSFDLAEIFKPLIVDPVIFSLVNKQKITENCFNKKLNYCYLNNKGKTLFLEEYDSKLHVTIKHKKLKRLVSYKRLLRLECYHLANYLREAAPYESFKKWW